MSDLVTTVIVSALLIYLLGVGGFMIVLLFLGSK